MKNRFFRTAPVFLFILTVLLPCAGGSTPDDGVTPLCTGLSNTEFFPLSTAPTPALQKATPTGDSPQPPAAEKAGEKKEERSPASTASPRSASPRGAGCCALHAPIDLFPSEVPPKRYLLYHAWRIAC